MLIGKKQAILDQYAAILSAFNKMESRDSELLQELQTGTGKAHRAIRKLSQLSAFFDQRLNVLVNIFLNSLILYDLQCMAALEKWKEINKAAFPGWIDAVGSIECLNSLAAFAYNNPDYVYPAPVTGDRLLIQAEKMAHPLIAAKERVTNDFVIGRDNRLVLVTGSNMSGKTTFLRTMGVNVLLAQCGAPVCAASFSFTPLQLLTSLRVSDSLQEHTSYFMAELKKLQQIIHRLHSGQPALVLIDEILRGTNSEDKTYGSEQFIRKLLRYHCLSLFASHDLSLGKLEEEMPGVDQQLLFRERHRGRRITFPITNWRKASPATGTLLFSCTKWRSYKDRQPAGPHMTSHRIKKTRNCGFHSNRSIFLINQSCNNERFSAVVPGELSVPADIPQAHYAERFFFRCRECNIRCHRFFYFGH